MVTDAALVAGLRGAAGDWAPRQGRDVVYVVRSGDAVAHATVRGATVEVGPGEHPEPDLVIVAGPGFRDLLAGVLDPDAAIDSGAVELSGDASLLSEFAATFRSPYSDAVPL